MPRRQGIDAGSGRPPSGGCRRAAGVVLVAHQTRFAPGPLRGREFASRLIFPEPDRGGLVMARKSRASGKDYEVGYGRPPKHSQFKPGVSGFPGGPHGKKAKAQKVSTLDPVLEAVLKVMDERVEVPVGGGTRRVTATEAVVRAIRDEILAGDVRRAGMLLELISRAHEADRSRPGPDGTEISEAVLEFAKWQRQRDLLQADEAEGGVILDRHEGEIPATEEAGKEDQQQVEASGSSSRQESREPDTPRRDARGDAPHAGAGADWSPPSKRRQAGEPLIVDKWPLKSHGWGTSGSP